MVPEKADTQSVQSESDNEGVKQEDLNLDDEFEKIVPSKIDEIDNIELTEEDQEIVKILEASENVENFEKIDVIDDATANINNAAASATVESEEIEKKIESDTLETEKSVSKDEITANLDNDAVVPSETTVDNTETSAEIKTDIDTVGHKETIIDEELLPKEAILKAIEDSEAEKPAIPLQTYLWEDVKRAKERVSKNQVCVFHMCTVPI